MLTEEGLQLLSATPLRRFTKSKFDLEKIKADIEAANKVMLQLLETVSMGLREPTFVRFYWNSVFLLIPQVIRARMDRAHEYGVPSQDIFDNIWEPTIDMLLGAERFGLRDGHEKLLYRDIYGPFVHWEPVRNPGLATCEFLDRLAMARDDLWRDYRAKVRPAVTALPKPWPRGLAIQQLLPDLKGQLHMPYLESRVKDTVFADGALALSPPPSDDETCEAIGPFVDDYDYALKHYLTTNASEFKTRVHAAWNHALDKLNGSRMSTEEATRFWRTKFRRAVQGTDTSLPDDIAPSYKKLRLTLPSDDGTANPTEWNPVPIEKTVPIERRQLPECILDCMLNCISSKWSSPTIDSAFSSERKSWTAEDDYPLILWDDCSSRLFPRGAGDALAAAAIAYINTKYGSDASLLLYPFPSKDDLRFPALYLDQDFLERVSKITDVSQPLESIKMLSCVMPVQFLVQLARSLMTRLAKNETDDPDVRQATMAVTKCVTRGDRPVLACELVQQVVLGQQDDSSWHRHLFSIRFLRRLSAREAHSFFDGLSSRVEEASQKLAQEQAKKRAAKAAQPQVPSQKTSTGLPSAASDDASQYFQPVVKVTTVKMIVQMLSRANFLDQQFACNILVRLLKCASHADIRVAIVESLLEILADNTDQNLESTVFDVLEEYVTPLAASMNERRPTTEEEWTAAEAGDAPLPAVAEETPILNLLMSALNKWKPNSPRRQQFLKRILEPTIVESGHNNRRWNAIFIQRHGFNISVNYLPTIPAVPSLFLQHFQSEAECWTRANLEVAKQFAAVNLCPSDSLVATNEAVRNDPELLRSNAGKHWLSLWSNPGSEAFPLGINQAANILARLVPSPEKGRLSVLEIQDFLLQWVEYFLMGSRTPELNELLSHLIPGRSKSYPKTIWLTNCLPVLQHVLTRVQSLRTDEWQCDTNREPATLPDTLSLKLKIFKEKHTTSKPNSHWESHIRTMVADASSLLDELLAEDAPYHENWPKFKNYMNIAPREHHVRVALEFTTPEISGKTKIGLKEYLKIEIADELLQSGSDPNDNEVVTRAHQLLHAWLGSPVERIRLRGEATSNLLETRAKSRNGWFQ
ncbi:uncharacterized protein BCR38DRAFT_452606 [Pseudomassariella vexata]|uniref:Uncharacterized protein n=1 Tax=Pseudomassariella vexata TaxID=1141098 RepID=A0A1Y2D7W6_9PEZI|nr:uncharacterized protein BCR38DRAFT_452606 [Pseudomassariella vexata]ORY55274.1 hypothetical protein BCR38DRAFT_452606 [Pseudomassariella vexata]